MKVVGIVAEYNPFHNGHAYQIAQAKLTTGADYVIVVMSGDYVQRGAPAIISKYHRTAMALYGGADLVLELPSHYACASAPDFATGAIHLLDSLGVVNYLSFGSECGSIAPFTTLASRLLEETIEFSNLMQGNLQQGMAYPKAFSQAFAACYPMEEDLLHMIQMPNNLLGIEYCKALLLRNSSMVPTTIPRNGSHYHAESLSGPRSSALALRKAMTSSTDYKSLSAHLPPHCTAILTEVSNTTPPVVLNDYSQLLRYQLQLYKRIGYTRFYQVPQSLSNRIQNHLDEFVTIEQFCNLLKTKDYTFARISRCLIHILLQITQEDMDLFTQDSYAHYARILGLKKSSSPLLHEMKHTSSIPLITKLSTGMKELDSTGRLMLEQTILHSELYHIPLLAAHKKNPYNEYTQQIVRID